MCEQSTDRFKAYPAPCVLTSGVNRFISRAEFAKGKINMIIFFIEPNSSIPRAFEEDLL